TTDEYEKGGATALRELVEAGATPSQVRAFLDALDAPDEDAVEVDEQPVEMEAERSRLGLEVVRDVPESVLKAGRNAGMRSLGGPAYLIAEEGLPAPGDYPEEARRQMLATVGAQRAHLASRGKALTPGLAAEDVSDVLERYPSRLSMEDFVPGDN